MPCETSKVIFIHTVLTSNFLWENAWSFVALLYESKVGELGILQIGIKFNNVEDLIVKNNDKTNKHNFLWMQRASKESSDMSLQKEKREELESKEFPTTGTAEQKSLKKKNSMIVSILKDFNEPISKMG